MAVVELDTPPRKPITDGSLKPISDRVTREPAEHPDRVPQETVPHPVTRGRRERRESVGAL